MFWAFPVGPGISVSFHALHLGLRSWAVEPTQAMPRAPFGEIVLEDCWSTSWNHETPWLLQQSSSNIRVILEKMTLHLSQGDIPRIFITWAQLRSVRRKAGSHLDVTVAATNWTSNRDVIFCSIFKHTMKVWCWSPKNCIFDVRCWMLADSGTASWCEVGCDACIFLPLAVVLLETRLRSMSGRLVGQVEMNVFQTCRAHKHRWFPYSNPSLWHLQVSNALKESESQSASCEPWWPRRSANLQFRAARKRFEAGGDAKLECF